MRPTIPSSATEQPHHDPAVQPLHNETDHFNHVQHHHPRTLHRLHRADDYRSAAVFTAHGIDFCRRGGRSFDEVCLPTSSIRPATGLASNKPLPETLHGGRPRPGRWRRPDHIRGPSPLCGNQCTGHSTIPGQTVHRMANATRNCSVSATTNGCASAMAAHMKKENCCSSYIKQLERQGQRHTSAHAPLRHGEPPGANDG